MVNDIKHHLTQGTEDILWQKISTAGDSTGIKLSIAVLTGFSFFSLLEDFFN